MKFRFRAKSAKPRLARAYELARTDQGYPIYRLAGLIGGPVLAVFLLLLGSPEGMEEAGWCAAALGLWMAVWWMLNDVDPRAWLADILAPLARSSGQAPRRAPALELAHPYPRRRCRLTIRTKRGLHRTRTLHRTLTLGLLAAPEDAAFEIEFALFRAGDHAAPSKRTAAKSDFWW